MKKCFVLFLILVLISTGICCFADSKPILTEVKTAPGWVKEYKSQTACDATYTDEGILENIVDKKTNVKIYVQKTSDQGSSLYCKIGSNNQRLLQSQKQFVNPRWSVNRKFFTIVNVTYAEDISYNGDIYVYKLLNNKLESVYSEREMGANPGSFSNDEKRFAYWSSINNFTIIDLITKRKSKIELPLKSGGFASSVAWRKDDKEIYITYVERDLLKKYLISNF